MEDATIRRISKKVFPHIWVRHKLMSSTPSYDIFPFSEITYFSQEIGNAVIVYLHMYRPTLSKYLEKHISSMTRSKMQFWTHVGFLCLQARLANDNVFDYFLTTCSITAEVALHCYVNGYEDVFPLASVFFCAFFENELHEGFHKAGGWLGFHHYIKGTLCPDLYNLIDGYIKELSSPSARLPILITTQNEHLAAERREKFVSLQSFKIGEIERDDPTKFLVTGIFHWDFMENQRISELKPGILRRMENIRHKKNKPNISIKEERSDESSEVDEAIDDDSKTSNSDKLLCLNDEAQPTELIATMFEARSNDNDVQTFDDIKSDEIKTESKNELFSNNETSLKTKFSSSSSLRDLCNFYESLSTSSERTTDDSKQFRSNDRKQNGPKSSTFKDITKREENLNLERYPRFITPSNENNKSFSMSKNVAPEKGIKSIKSFCTNDALSEFTESFQALGFRCLCIGDSTNLNEKSSAFSDYEEILEKCRYFQNKYSSVKFVILIPNNYFPNKRFHAPEIEKSSEICFEKQCSEKKLSTITNGDFTSCIISPPRHRSEIKKSKFIVTKVDENQLKLANKLSLIQNCATENIPKSRFVVTKVDENDFHPRIETSEISRFSVTKVNESHLIVRNEKSLMEKSCTTEPTTVSRFRVTKVNENESKDEINITRENCTTKTSRFTVTKVNENQSEDGTCILQKNWTNETIKISRFTVKKVNESQSMDGKSILRQNWINETNKISRSTDKMADDKQLISRTGKSLLRKSYPSHTSKTPQLANIRFDESPAIFSERNNSISSEISDDTENETVQFQANGSVRYRKRVSFAEHTSINYYHPYSSDDSPNSRTSLGSQNSLDDSLSSRNSEHNASQESVSGTPSLRNSTINERRRFFQRHSSEENQSSSGNAEKSTSFGFGFLDKIFKRSNSRSSKVNEKERKERDRQKIDELRMSLEAEGVKNPVVFKV
ncbi:hypothetical protein HNY73_019128 [Argiope bruennichi]|uniref:Uncharacterized protein n=1 Tax=Argiope bruennichi TaxID=94029 RepID=A0A8T0EGM0_ARGBR|nr:hypothetical protein HNY73_019128 [Argiope bruennichi]